MARGFENVREIISSQKWLNFRRTFSPDSTRLPLSLRLTERDYFGISKRGVKRRPQKTFSRNCFNSCCKKNGETKTERVLDDLKMSKLETQSHELPLNETRRSENVFAIILL